MSPVHTAVDLAKTQGSSPEASGLRLCPACGHDNRRREPAPWSQAPWILKQCGDCGFLYLENSPPDSAFVDQFAWEKTTEWEMRRRRGREPVLVALNHLRAVLSARLVRRRRGGKLCRLLEQHAGAGRVLDVGCGHGALLKMLPPEMVPYGIEISVELAPRGDSHAQPRGGYVIQGAAFDMLPQFADGFFSGIVMCSYLEHELQPQAVLRKARRILRPGGALIIKVPNFACWNRRLRGQRWCGFRFPDHANYFTPRSLVRMLREQGFEIGRFNLADHLPTNDNMWVVARKPGSACSRS